MSEVAEELMSAWAAEHSADPQSERFQMEHAVRILVESVCAQLGQNHEWATEALIHAGMGLPGSTVFDRRIGHFSLEKQELSTHFARWLLLRVINLLNKGKKVFIVCDSGTTVFWFLKVFGEAISDYFSNGPIPHFAEIPKITPEKLTGLMLITNNIPGAEAFVTYASHHNLSLSSSQTRLSDLVECRLLAGVLLPAYVAVTGDDTDRDLEVFWKEAKRHDPSAVFIGIATGNWLSIGRFENLALPHLLARGRGHGSFKKTLLDVSEETFVLAPLGKIFMKSVVDLNSVLNYSPQANDPQERSYEAVPIPSGKSKTIKLVSTFREKSSLLLLHSAQLRSAIEEYTTLMDYKAAVLPIGKVRHLLLPFDRFSAETLETQIEIELPHKRTRTKEFKKKFFSVDELGESTTRE